MRRWRKEAGVFRGTGPGADISQLPERAIRELRDVTAMGPRHSGPRTFSEIVGKSLEAEQVGRLLGVSPGELAERCRGGQLIAVRGKQRDELFPAWQFDRAAAAVRPAVRGVISAFDEHLHEIDALLIASWATSRNVKDLDGKTPAQWIESGGDDERVVTAARRTAVRLAW